MSVTFRTGIRQPDIHFHGSPHETGLFLLPFLQSDNLSQCLMVFCQACVRFYGKGVVSRESIFQWRWRRVGPGKAACLQKLGAFSFWLLLGLLSTVFLPCMLSV